jgi:hypothetical protein
MIHPVDLARRPRPVVITRDGQPAWRFLGTAGARPPATRPSGSATVRPAPAIPSIDETGWLAMLTPRRTSAPANPIPSRGAQPRRSLSR